MSSAQKIHEMEKTLDALITNASLLRECEEENGECAALEHEQESLLNDLMSLNNSLNDAEKQRLLSNTPRLYSTLESKISRLSRLNQRLIRPPHVRFIKKARVHRRPKKKPPTQLPLDLT